MAAAGAHERAAPPAPPAAAAAQPTSPTAPPRPYAEQVRESVDLLRALFAQLDAAGSGDPLPGFFEPCRGRPGEEGWAGLQSAHCRVRPAGSWCGRDAACEPQHAC